MADESENVKQTPMDRKIDQKVKAEEPVKEKYSQSALGNLPLADQPEPESEQEPTKLASWTIAEVERALSHNVLKPSSIKIDQFSQSVNKKSDLRLRTLSRLIGDRIRQDQQSSDPKAAKKLSDFEIQSQTMRMVTANAAMGSYQFQKTLVLPYMRKSLALGYQKVSLLKDVVKSIQSSEKSIVSKLEAIKINTASTAPRQKSYFKRLMDDVSFLNVRRVAGNISAYTMDGYEKLYNKFVSPATRKMYKMLSSDRKQDGVNGIRRTLTGKLNSIRRSVRDYSDKSSSEEGKLSKIKTTGASIVSRILGGSVKGVQNLKLSDTKNSSISNILRGPMEDVARFNPFSSKGPLLVDIEESGNRTGIVSPTPNSEPIKPLQGLQSESIVQKLLSGWRNEDTPYRDKVVQHLSNIDDAVNGCKLRCGSVVGGRNKRSNINTPTKKYRNRPSLDIPTTLTISESENRSIGDRIVGGQSETAADKPNIISPASEERSRTTIGAKLKSIRARDAEDASGLTSTFKKLLAPLYKQQILDRNPREVVQNQKPVESPFEEGKLNRSFFTTLFDRLGSKVTGVSKSVDDGNVQRTRFEKIQTKWRDLAEKLRPKAIRKNSYEDVRSRKDDVPKGLFGRAFDRVKASAQSTGSKLLAGDVLGAGGDIVSGVTDWVKDEVADAVGDSVREKAGRGLKRLGRRARVGGRRTLSRLMGRGVASAAATGGVASAGKRSLGRKAASLLWRGTKAVGKGGGKVALKGAGSILSGGLSLVKTTAPAAIAGIAGSYANDWFEKNTTGTTRRLGTTASSMAQWGATGATLGSIIPGVGTGVGAAIGAGLGAIAANTDLVSQSLSALGGVVSGSASYLWTGLFGKDAKLDPWGRVKEKEQRSLIGNIYGSVFGQDAKYAKSGEVVRPGKEGLIPYVYKGFKTFLFGDEKKSGKLKTGLSIFASISQSIFETMADFKKGMSSLPDQIKSIYGSVQQAAGEVYDKGKEVAGSAYNSVKATVGNVFKGRAVPVSDAKAIAQELIPGIQITSHRRRPGQAGKAGSNSWHVKSGAAIDVAPVKGMDFESFKRKFTDAGYPLIEAIDETDPATMKKTGATGPHWHIVIGQRTSSSTPYSGPNGPASWSGASKENPYGGGNGPMKGGYVSKDGKQLFNRAVSHLIKRGWSKTAAIGIATNLFGESGLKTSSFNGAGGGQGAKGIAQWRGERITAIESKFGKKISDMSLEEQLDAVDWELRDGKHVTSDRSIENGTTPIVDAINNSKNMEQVVQQMVYRYERPEASTRASETARRINEGYSLVGAVGQNTTPAPAKPKTGQQPGSQQAQSTKPKQPNTPQKPKPSKKPSTPAPSPVVNSSSIDKLDGAIDKWISNMNSSASTNVNTNVVTTPVSMGGKNNNGNNNVSLKKERIRTGA